MDAGSTLLTALASAQRGIAGKVNIRYASTTCIESV